MTWLSNLTLESSRPHFCRSQKRRNQRQQPSMQLQLQSQLLGRAQASSGSGAQSGAKHVELTFDLWRR